MVAPTAVNTTVTICSLHNQSVEVMHDLPSEFTKFRIQGCHDFRLICIDVSCCSLWTWLSKVQTFGGKRLCYSHTRAKLKADNEKMNSRRQQEGLIGYIIKCTYWFKSKPEHFHCSTLQIEFALETRRRSKKNFAFGKPWNDQNLQMI